MDVGCIIPLSEPVPWDVAHVIGFSGKSLNLFIPVCGSVLVPERTAFQLPVPWQPHKFQGMDLAGTQRSLKANLQPGERKHLTPAPGTSLSKALEGDSVLLSFQLFFSFSSSVSKTRTL